jgi:hypothetical protein
MPVSMLACLGMTFTLALGSIWISVDAGVVVEASWARAIPPVARTKATIASERIMEQLLERGRNRPDRFPK